MWPYCGLKFRAYRDHADQVLVFDWIAAHLWLTCSNQGRVVRKSVNTNPGLKVYRSINFSWFDLSAQFLKNLSNKYLICLYKAEGLFCTFSLALPWLHEQGQKHKMYHLSREPAYILLLMFSESPFASMSKPVMRNHLYGSVLHLHVYFHVSQIPFHMQRFARGLVLKQRQMK